jgi:ComF family protein
MGEAIAEKRRWGQTLVALGGRLFRMTVDFLVPPKCLACRTTVTQGACLCVTCWQKLTFIDEPVCAVMGLPFAFDQGEGAVSAAALAAPPDWDRARAAVAFDDPSRRLVHALKYRDQPEAGLMMASAMARAGRKLLAGADLVIPVPLHRRRLWQRRFNQSAFLAGIIARRAGKPFVTDVLVRRLPTRTQVGLSHEERQKNVRRAFAADGEKQALLAGKKVVLIDDVLTTGATANACARVLKEAGAAEVDVLVFALVLEPKRPHIDA